MSKHVIVCGGVYSGTGKGVACASMGLIMKLRGHSINYLKLDPYLNENSSIISPKEHGESWVTEDGKETDLDLGHAERLAGITTTAKNICTSGSFYKELIEDQDKYLGSSLQVVPHLTNKIIQKLESFDEEVLFTEIGGTIGDIESGHFYEAIRQLKQKKPNDVIVIMVAPVLWVPTICEFKTKPLQNAVRNLLQHGIQPDIILCRSVMNIPKSCLEKIATFTNVPKECIIEALDTKSIYEVPIELYKRQLDEIIVDRFKFKRNACRIKEYKKLVQRIGSSNILEVGVVCKYENSQEAYISLREALIHAGAFNNVSIKINWINAEEIEKDASILSKFNMHGIIIPGGFDHRGVEGKILAVQYARENKIPLLGLCLGLQCSVIEFSRNVCALKDANSLEFNKDTKNPVVHYVKGQESITKKLGTMRLGAYDCDLLKDSISFSLYGKSLISERHRHRYEVNLEYENIFAKNGFFVTGRNPQSGLIEIMELDKELHPYFIGTQAHPELKSRLDAPAPLFNGLVKAAILHASQSQVNPKE